MNRIAPGVPIPKSVQLPLLAAAFGALIFTAVQATSVPLTDLVKSTYKDPAAGEQPKEAEDAAPSDSTTVSRGKSRCKHCGIVEAKRQVGGVHEITVRLADRSTYVFSDTSPNWRLGERIILIGGGNSPRR